ncbi:MAG: hypothetical protein ACRD06_09520, partial [Terriglobia bacterium]
MEHHVLDIVLGASASVLFLARWLTREHEKRTFAFSGVRAPGEIAAQGRPLRQGAASWRARRAIAKIAGMCAAGVALM